jgi:hypothetical protein
MNAPGLAGLYIVTLSNSDPLPVNPPPGPGDVAPISVTSANCKFGRAANLRWRESRYRYQFGAEHVAFRPIATVSSLQDLKELESKVLATVHPHRIPSSTGRATEWLQGISAAELEFVVISTLRASGRAFSLLTEANLMSLSAAASWPPSPIQGTELLVPITSWEMMLDETKITGVEFDGFWLDNVESGVAYFFRWLGEPRATVLAIWDGKDLKHLECRGVGDTELERPDSADVVQSAYAQFSRAGFVVPDVP